MSILDEMCITASSRSSLRARRRSAAAAAACSRWQRVGMQSQLERSEPDSPAAARHVPQIACRGFTLVELVVTIAVGGILVALAVPSFRTFIQNSRLTAQTNSLVTSLDYARSEAIKRDAAVSVCAADANATTCNGSATWSTGWIVQDPSSATPLQTVPPTTGGVALTAATAGPITFNQNGTTGGAVSFTVCDSRGAAYAHEIEVSPSGRIQAAAKRGYALDGVTALVCP